MNRLPRAGIAPFATGPWGDAPGTASHGLVRTRKLLKRGAVLAALVLVLFLASPYAPAPLVGSGEGDGLSLTASYWSEGESRQFLLSLGPYSAVTLVLFQASQVVLPPVPAELIGIVAGYLYGAWFGFLLSTIGLILGSWVVFELARVLGRPFVERTMSARALTRLGFFASNWGAVTCFVLFALPGFPKDYLCGLLGMSRMRFATFMILASLGRMPATYVLALQGAKFHGQGYLAAGLVVAGFCAVVVAAYLCRDRLFLWLQARADRRPAGR